MRKDIKDIKETKILNIFRQRRRRLWRKYLIFIIFCSLLFIPRTLVLADTATSTGTTTVSASHTFVPTPNNRTGGETADTTSPSAVANLTAGLPTATTITLTWTAPGDDAGSGIASQYDIRYAASTITDANWAMATAISNAPTPVAPGRTQSVIVSGLLADTTYFFALKTADEVPNWSGLSNSPSAKTLKSGLLPDTTPPAISNIQISHITGTSAMITFGTDEGAASAISYGQTTSYELGEIKQAQFLTSHFFVLKKLTPEKIYHFKIKATDAADNERISEDQTFTTLDITAPVITDIQIITDVISTHITWQTNESADSQIAYGLTNKLGTINSDVHLVTDHSLEISGLKPNTKYFFVIRSTDLSGNQGSSDLLNLITLKDFNSPANVSNLQARPGDKIVDLGWQNPADFDLAGVLIRRSTSDYPKNPTEGTKIYQGAGQSFQDSNLINGVLYYYTVFAYDTSDNYASGALVNAAPQAVFIPQCRDGLDNDADGQTDFPDDLGCEGLEDNDEASPIVSKSQCSDGKDNDGDSLIDYPADPGCVSSADNDEVNEIVQPPVVVPSGGGTAAVEYRLELTDFQFSVAKGKILVAPAQKISTLIGTGLGISLDQEKSKKSIQLLIINLDKGSYLFNFGPASPSQGGPDKKQWQTELTVPNQPGVYQADIIANYFDNTTSVTSFQLETLPYGQVYEKAMGEKKPVAEAKVSLLTSPALWPAKDFEQLNPQITGPDGSFGFLVPAGKYILRVEKQGYRTEETNYFDSQGVAVNKSIELMLLPPSLKDVINPEAPVLENMGQVVKNLGQKTIFASKVAGKEIKKFADNPAVEEETKKIAAPAVAGAVTASTVAAVGLTQLLAYLRFLFTQPILVLFRRRRRGWGVVYNSLTKMPIELTIVRLVEAATGRIIQSRVTDKQGRYAFFPAPGTYHLDVSVPQFKFPTEFFAQAKEDGAYLDLYHGEAIEVREKGALITANIPLDPLGQEKPIRKIIWELTRRRIQNIVGIVSPILALIFLLIIPSIITVCALILQVAVYLIFRRLAYPRRPKSWGIIYNETDKQPLGRAIARIFDRQYNKLLESQVSDPHGRYSFLVGRNEYFMTYEKGGYHKKQSETVDLKNHPEPVAAVGIDVALKPLGSQPPEPAKPPEPPPPPELPQI